MKLLKFLLPLLCFSTPLFSQTEYMIKNFSDDYSGKIYSKGVENSINKWTISIIEGKTKKEVIHFDFEELMLNLNEKNEATNEVIYQDFNFDETKDIAILDGSFSCYGGPSYQVFLGTTLGFTHSPEFTRLAQEYCGMFQVDYENKKIKTATKSGCCWHQFSEFIVENNIPKVILIKEKEVDMSSIGYIYNIKQEKWNGTKMIVTKTKELLVDYIKEFIVLDFSLEKNSKKVYLIKNHENQLNYVFTKKNDEIEFDYGVENKNPTFELLETDTELSLTFKNQHATYKIYEDKVTCSMGVQVIVDGKTYDNKAKSASIQGELGDLKDKKFINVSIK